MLSELHSLSKLIWQKIWHFCLFCFYSALSIDKILFLHFRKKPTSLFVVMCGL